jgi:hypothetical protein
VRNFRDLIINLALLTFEMISLPKMRVSRHSIVTVVAVILAAFSTSSGSSPEGALSHSNTAALSPSNTAYTSIDQSVVHSTSNTPVSALSGSVSALSAGLGALSTGLLTPVSALSDSDMKNLLNWSVKNMSDEDREELRKKAQQLRDEQEGKGGMNTMN